MSHSSCPGGSTIAVARNGHSPDATVGRAVFHALPQLPDDVVALLRCEETRRLSETERRRIRRAIARLYARGLPLYRMAFAAALAALPWEE